MERTVFLRGLVREMAEARLVPAGSLKNCHARGLHSLVLREAPMVRMFVTTPDHELWKMHRGIPATIAIHQHRTDLRLETVRGRFENWVLSPDRRFLQEVELDAFSWDSAIVGGAGKFTPTISGGHGFVGIRGGADIIMAAEEFHTVWVEEGQRAAWLVTEGAPNPNYVPIAYSTVDLSKWSPEGLYEPMTADFARELLDWVIGG